MTDQPLITWVRLFDGRLWHIDTLVFVSLCGRNYDPGDPGYRPVEYLHDVVPANGWICDRCVRRLAEQAAYARQSWLQDPRRHPGDQLPGPDEDSPPAADPAPASDDSGSEI